MLQIKTRKSYELKANNFPSPTTPLTPLKGRTGLTRNSYQIKTCKWFNIKEIAQWGFPLKVYHVKPFFIMGVRG